MESYQLEKEREKEEERQRRIEELRWQRELERLQMRNISSQQQQLQQTSNGNDTPPDAAAETTSVAGIQKKEVRTIQVRKHSTLVGLYLNKLHQY